MSDIEVPTTQPDKVTPEQLLVRYNEKLDVILINTKTSKEKLNQILGIKDQLLANSELSNAAREQDNQKTQDELRTQDELLNQQLKNLESELGVIKKKSLEAVDSLIALDAQEKELTKSLNNVGSYFPLLKKLIENEKNSDNIKAWIENQNSIKTLDYHVKSELIKKPEQKVDEKTTHKNVNEILSDIQKSVNYVLKHANNTAIKNITNIIEKQDVEECFKAFKEARAALILDAFKPSKKPSLVNKVAEKIKTYYETIFELNSSSDNKQTDTITVEKVREKLQYDVSEMGKLKVLCMKIASMFHKGRDAEPTISTTDIPSF